MRIFMCLLMRTCLIKKKKKGGRVKMIITQQDVAKWAWLKKTLRRKHGMMAAVVKVRRKRRRSTLSTIGSEQNAYTLLFFSLPICKTMTDCVQMKIRQWKEKLNVLKETWELFFIPADSFFSLWHLFDIHPRWLHASSIGQICGDLSWY